MNKKIIFLSSLIIIILSVMATLTGLFWPNLYQHDTISIISQMQGQDLITLIIVIPILVGSIYLVSKNSLRGRLIWMGTIFYFIYTYASLSFAASYNQLFLVYVAIFSLALFAFLGELVSLDIKKVRESFSSNSMRKITAVFLAIVGLMLASMWLKMIVDSLLVGTNPPALETYTTLVIQALDLGVVVPTAILSSYLLMKNNEWGFVIASVFLIKAALLGTAILSMVLFMVLNGVAVDMGQVIFFIILTVSGIVVASGFYSKIKGIYLPMTKNDSIKSG
ncbi:hypothetical protein [Methanobacterium alcaliphilum]|uniref:hypothetical protein n=1 Tax=Methanobacterium alcaliphilum TaxID=392018 RepID=UPI00200A4B59|nr:hypothetical protein [Methanobacterium alcaliphilum]MCK9152255.1 hypothetical protein [Methanobacterium alcaliphilum]